MTRSRDVASVLTAANALGTDIETATAVSAHSSATDPHGDRADTTTQISTHAALTATHGATGAVVGTTNTQTLTNKTIDTASNTITGAVTLTGTQTLTNKTLTAPVISSISNSGTVTIPTGTDTLVNLAGSQTLSNKTLTTPTENNPYIKSPREFWTVSATAATGTIQFDVATQGVLYYTTASSANWTLNFRGTSGTTLASLMNTGDAITVNFLVTNTTAYYQSSAVTVDTNATVTVKWSGGTAAASGNASAIDIYSYTIVKTGASAFTVLCAGPVKYA